MEDKPQQKSIVYQRSDHFSFLEKLRKEENLCDVTIEVGDKKFRAHKIILAGSITYFEKMFFNEFVESNKEIITVHTVKPSSMEAFLNFAYTGRINLTESNVQELMIDASFLDIVDIMNECTKFLEMCIVPENVFDIYYLAEALSCISLQDKSYKFMRQHFLDASQSEQYLQLSVEFLKDILSSDELSIFSPEKVFEAVIKWIKSDIQKRKIHLLDFLRLVRLSEASDLYLVKNVIENELIANSVQCRDFVNEIIYAKIKSKHERGRILVIGENKEKRLNIEIYNPCTNKWDLSTTIKHLGHGYSCIVYETKLYIFGGLINGKAVANAWVYDYDKKSLKSLSSMHIKRCSAGISALNGYLYVCGGTDFKNDLHTVERYCLATNEWKIVASLNHSRSLLQAISFQGYIYALGGSHNLHSVNLVERYDPRSNQWMIVDSTMNVKRQYFGASVFNGKLYVCGGRSDHIVNGEGLYTHPLSTVEVYDPELNRWEFVTSMQKPRFLMLMLVNMEKLFAIGGWSDDSTALSSVEVYDPETDLWSYAPSMKTIIGDVTGGVIPM